MTDMEIAMLKVLCEIDAELGLPDDGCNSPQRTLHAIVELRKHAARYEWLHQFDRWSWTKPPMRAISFYWSISCSKEDLDAAIDEAMRTTDSNARTESAKQEAK